MATAAAFKAPSPMVRLGHQGPEQSGGAMPLHSRQNASARWLPKTPSNVSGQDSDATIESAPNGSKVAVKQIEEKEARLTCPPL